MVDQMIVNAQRNLAGGVMKGLSSPHRPRLPFVDQSSDAVVASCAEYVDNPEPFFA